MCLSCYILLLSDPYAQYVSFRLYLFGRIIFRMIGSKVLVESTRNYLSKRRSAWRGKHVQIDMRNVKHQHPRCQWGEIIYPTTPVVPVPALGSPSTLWWGHTSRYQTGYGCCIATDTEASKIPPGKAIVSHQDHSRWWLFFGFIRWA